MELIVVDVVWADLELAVVVSGLFVGLDVVGLLNCVGAANVLLSLLLLLLFLVLLLSVVIND